MGCNRIPQGRITGGVSQWREVFSVIRISETGRLTAYQLIALALCWSKYNPFLHGCSQFGIGDSNHKILEITTGRQFASVAQTRLELNQLRILIPLAFIK